MTCPHLTAYPWGRDDAAMICDIDGFPCDEERREMCEEEQARPDTKEEP